MPILRPISSGIRRETNGITLTCPKCGANIIVSGLNGNKPIRCGECSYPLIKGSDLMPLIKACEQISNSDIQRVSIAAQILSRLSVSFPEAAIALSRLVNRMPSKTISEFERFNALLSAYAAGNSQAQEMLDDMCKSDPKAFEVRTCKCCGAKKYTSRMPNSKVRCIYCQSED